MFQSHAHNCVKLNVQFIQFRFFYIESSVCITNRPRKKTEKLSLQNTWVESVWSTGERDFK